MIYKLTQGLGDCLIVGSVLQHLPNPTITTINYKTNPLLKFLFDEHPRIKYVEDESSEPVFTFSWVSQLRKQGLNLYPLHTVNRFSFQANYFLDPSKTLDYWRNGGIIKNKPLKRKICINLNSAEHNRRFIPNENLVQILKKFEGYEIVYLGSGAKDSITDIKQMIDELETCDLFIGPISFCYHLAACLDVKSLLFTGYMPSHKFSHFKNTICVETKELCNLTCEEERDSCHTACMALKYDNYYFNSVLDYTAKWIKN